MSLVEWGASGWKGVNQTAAANPGWPSNTEYLLRRWFDGDDFTVDFTVDNHAWIYWDGVLVAEGDNEPEPFCPLRSDHAPASGSLGYGKHLLAIRANDRGEECYFDCRVELTGGRAGWFIGHIGIAPGVGVA